MSTDMVKLMLKQDCYLICYDINSSQNEEIRNMIVELAGVKRISDPSEYMLSESCYLIPANKRYDFVSIKLRNVTHRKDKLHIFALKNGTIFSTKITWFIASEDKYVFNLYDTISIIDESNIDYPF